MSDLTQPSTSSVVSGQQIGLLGGPLFVLYKILGVYYLANQTNTVYPHQTDDLSPVFWLETNDADFNEIRYFYGLNDSGQVNKYIWSPKQKRGGPIGDYLVDTSLQQLYRDYFKQLPQTTHTQEIQDLVFTSYKINTTLADSNRFFFEKIFSFFESTQKPSFKKIKWFLPFEEEFRKYSQPLLQQEIRNTPIEQQCPVFAWLNGRRESLFKKQDQCVTRKGLKVNWEKETLLPSVWNRSLLQDDYLKVAYYIAGPAEKIYLHDLQPRYRQYGITPAKVIDRMSLTLFTPSILKEMQFLGLTKDQLIQNDLQELIRSFQKISFLGGSLYDLRKKFMQDKEEKIQKLLHQENLTESKRREILQQEKAMYRDIKHELGKKRLKFKTEYTEKLTTLSRIMDWVHPSKNPDQHIPQERYHNIVTLLNQYGLNVIEELYQHYAFKTKTMVIHP